MADAEFGGEFDDGPADGEELSGLGFELGWILALTTSWLWRWKSMVKRDDLPWDRA